MRVLLTGATGFIGTAVAKALARAGHEVIALGRRSVPALDFTHATCREHWQPHLKGVDAVVNAVGVLRDSARAPMDSIHCEAPRALFEACAQEGVRRVVHISALGIERNPTRYAQTKRSADDVLLALTQAGQLDGLVLRPSVVFGKNGASSELFIALSRLPFLMLPRPVLHARVQPLAVGELAQAIVALLPQRHSLGLMELAGPKALTLAEFIASLRQQRGKSPAPARPLPDWATRVSAWFGDQVPISPWCSETLALLATDNVAEPGRLSRLLGHAATEPSCLLATLEGPEPA